MKLAFAYTMNYQANSFDYYHAHFISDQQPPKPLISNATRGILRRLSSSSSNKSRSLRQASNRMQQSLRALSSFIHPLQCVFQAKKSCRDAECEVRPKTINKYVACRPNSKSKSTEILKVGFYL